MRFFNVLIQTKILLTHPQSTASKGSFLARCRLNKLQNDNSNSAFHNKLALSYNHKSKITIGPFTTILQTTINIIHTHPMTITLTVNYQIFSTIHHHHNNLHLHNSSNNSSSSSNLRASMASSCKNFIFCTTSKGSDDNSNVGLLSLFIFFIVFLFS